MKKNATRNALFLSAISLLLCVSMLVGATFAWFTDEVTSGLNTIAAGNLDIELYHTNANVTNEQVKSNTELFFDVNGQEIKWEPGVVAYENLEIANVGSLALQYRLSLNIADENTLNGHGLSEVLKVVFLDQPIAAGATRADVLALAAAALADPDYTLEGTLAQMIAQDKLLPGETSGVRAMVIFWEPNADEIDNLYNANNDQVTSDGEPLHISFGVKLEATQLMHENDSFGPDYDKYTGFQPMPAVNGTYETINFTYGIGGAADTIVMDTAYQFRPTESLENGQLSQYYNYIVDFVVSADAYVPADSIMLAGYYDAWCQYNNDNWVGLIGGDVAANQEIRLVKDGLGNAAIVQYKHLLEYGNDGIGFLCGAKDLTGENAGTTLTVKLNLYKTFLNDAGHYEETGEVITVGTFTYTFGGLGVNTADQLVNAVTNGAPAIKLNNDIDLGATQIAVPADKEIVLDLNGNDLTGNFAVAGHYAMFTIPATSSLTVKGEGNVTANTAAQENNRSLAIFMNSGKLILDGGNYTVNDASEGKTWIIATIVDNRTNSASCATELIINGGTYNVAGNAKNLFRNYPQQGGSATLTINDGLFNDAGATTYIWNQESGSYPGILNFNGGTYGAQVVYEDYNGQSDINIAPGVVINAYAGNN